jgi:hypothetical protein
MGPTPVTIGPAPPEAGRPVPGAAVPAMAKLPDAMRPGRHHAGLPWPLPRPCPAR